MRPAPLLPRVHFFVCANRRDASSPLGPGCGVAGERVYDAFKSAVAAEGLVRAVWVTETKCLGVCPKTGCTVAAYPEGRIDSEVDEADVPSLLRAARERGK